MSTRRGCVIDVNDRASCSLWLKRCGRWVVRHLPHRQIRHTYTQCSQAPKRTKPLSHFTDKHPPRASRYLWVPALRRARRTALGCPCCAVRSSCPTSPRPAARAGVRRDRRSAAVSRQHLRALDRSMASRSSRGSSYGGTANIRRKSTVGGSESRKT